MIALLRGSIAMIQAESIIVDVSGVGLQVFVPTPLKDRLGVGEMVYLYTHLVVREDSLALYGFETKEGKEIFDLLIGVNGIGPRLALSILSTLNPDTIRRAIFNEQVDVFCRVPGIGKKTAQKVLLYLQDRIPTGEGLAPISALSDVDSEILAALTGLGYSVVEAQAALQYIPRDAPQDVETRLRLALQYFSAP
jgi:Holliday junction DNA helicase RuvA